MTLSAFLVGMTFVVAVFVSAYLVANSISDE